MNKTIRQIKRVNEFCKKNTYSSIRDMSLKLEMNWRTINNYLYLLRELKVIDWKKHNNGIFIANRKVKDERT